MYLILNGIAYGLLLAVLIGPVFFSLVQTSIEEGLRAGAWLAVGILLSDVFYISICYLGMEPFMDNPLFKKWLGIIGGGVMIIFAVIMFFKNVRKEAHVAVHVKKKFFLRFIIRGFLLNGINPSVLIFWIGMVGAITAHEEYSQNQIVILFSCMMGTVFLTDILKAFLSHKLGRFITYRVQSILNKILGVGLFCFGSRLLYISLF